MRAVVQRVSEASVAIAGDEVARIATGLLALVGVEVGDERADADLLAFGYEDFKRAGCRGFEFVGDFVGFEHDQNFPFADSITVFFAP